MKKIIIAGSTGYLGRHLVKVLQRRQIPFQAIARNKKKLLDMGLGEEDIIWAQATQPQTFKGRLDGAEVLISTVGITRHQWRPAMVAAAYPLFLPRKWTLINNKPLVLFDNKISGR